VKYAIPRARSVRPVVVGTALLMCASCGGQRAPAVVPSRPAEIVLLPDTDTGTTGSIRVSNEFGSVDMSSPRQMTRATPTTGPEAVRTLSEAEVSQRFGTALGALPPPSRHFTLGFRFESDELTPDSAALVPEILAAAKGMPFPEVAIIGHTDTMGDARANAELGLRRAGSIQRLLLDAGVDGSTITVSSHGEADLLIKTPNNTPEPRNRRVEVVVR
jgi:outer membrane protein OmpA-like peptidoglycan-associated protein